jgi:predicted RNA-binding protein YlqC (UPF0109 family)
LGTRNEIPKPAITITEINLRLSADILLRRTIVERERVKKVKLRTKPTTTPIGLDFPISLPPKDEDKIIGKMGKMHGESIVTIPAKKANAISKIIFALCF